MLLARAFVLGVNSRAALAIALVGMSVAYAVLTGAAAGGLRDAGSTLEPGLVEHGVAFALPGLAPFPAGAAPAAATLLAHGDLEGLRVGTVRPWRLGAEAVPGPYVRASPEALAALGLEVGKPQPHEAPWDWVLVPPDAFDRLFPDLMGRATLAYAARGAPAPALGAYPMPAAGAFYGAGAQQVLDSIHLVVLAMGVTVAVLAGGVLRLEVLARERELATLEALGGLSAARRAVLLRTAFLVGAGVLGGLAAGLGGAALGGRALGAGALRVEPDLVLEAALVALLAGLGAGAAGGLARLRAPLPERLGRRGPSARRFPGPVRFLLVTPRLAPSAFASALVLASVSTVVLAASAVPFEVFEPQDGTLVLGRAEGNPFRGTADRFWGEHAGVLEGIEAASPETIVPTLLGARPVVVRGVHLPGWLAVDEPRLLEGAWPLGPDEASAGARLARTAGLALGDVVEVPGAYKPTLRALRIVGVHEAGSLLDDELLTDLDTAGDLAGLPPEHVHMVRVGADKAGLAQANAAPALVVAQLRTSPAEPVPFTIAVAEATLVNFDARPQGRLLALHVNDVLVASVQAEVPGRTVRTVPLPFVVPDAPELVLRLNPTTTVSTSEPGLEVQAPGSVAPNTTFEARVLDRAGQPVAGAALGSDREHLATGPDGRATLSAGPPGVRTLTARAAGLEGGAEVFVVDPAWALGPRIQAERALVTSSRNADADRARHELTLQLVNLGGARFDGELALRAGDEAAGSVALALDARARLTVAAVALVPRAARSLEVAGLAVELPEVPAPGAPPPPADPGIAPEPAPAAPRTVAELLAERRRSLEEGEAARELSGEAFLEDLFATLRPSATLIILLTFLHAGAGVAVAALREVRERSGVQEVLAQLGADPEKLAARAARDALLAVLPGLVAGAGLAVAGFALLQPWGFPGAFGHTVPAPADLGLAVRVVAGLAAVAVLAAVWGARSPAEEPLRQVQRKPLALLLGERA